MKWFHIFVLVFGILLNYISCENNASASVSCEEEAWKLLDDFNNCGPKNFDALHTISGIFEDFLDRTMNRTEFSQTVIEYCDIMKTAASCSLAIVPRIKPNCRHNPLTERFVNLVRLLIRLETGFCFENILYNIVNDSSLRCLFKRKMEACRQEAPTLLDTEYSTDDKHICASLHHYQACGDQFFAECESVGQITTYAKEAWNMLDDEFSCNNEL